jgi:hypothetical protein
MRSLRPRILVATAAAAALALTAPGPAGAGIPLREAVAEPSTVTAGETSVITPASEDDGCQIRPPAAAAVSTAGGINDDVAVDYSVVPEGGDESIDKDSVPIDEAGMWSISLDTTGYAAGVYEVTIQCTLLAPSEGEVLVPAGIDDDPAITRYDVVLVTVVEPAAPPAPTPPPATEAEAITAAPTFTG